MPRGARHGASGSWVLQDDYRPAREIPWNTGPNRNIPDGSCYQHARAAYYANEEEKVLNPKNDKEYIVLSREYDLDGTRHAVTLKDSNWRAGTGTGEDYSPYYKYDLTLRVLDENGEIDWYRTPEKSLSIKIQPQQDGLVDSDGRPLNLPHGCGTLLWVTSTWIESYEQLQARAADLLEHALGYEMDQLEVAQGSEKFWKGEVHHRITEEKEKDVVHVLRRSAELLGSHGADVETRGLHEDNAWSLVKFKTRGWEKLGFPISGLPILIKLYYPDNPDAVAYPMDQPKLEVALEGNPGGAKVPRERWDEVMRILENILLSHLKWAGVSSEDLVADDYSDGAGAERVEVQHPTERPFWLEQHYRSLETDLIREATKSNTMAIYDILQCVSRHEGALRYKDISDETGIPKRTVRRHVTRLAEEIGGDDPGILEKVRGQHVWVDFSSEFLAEHAEQKLDETHPEDSLEDEKKRAKKRREERQSEDDEDVDEDDRADQEDAATDATWRYFSEVALEGTQLGRALDLQHLDHDHVRVRVDESPLFSTG